MPMNESQANFQIDNRVRWVWGEIWQFRFNAEFNINQAILGIECTQRQTRNVACSIKSPRTMAYSESMRPVPKPTAVNGR